MKHTIKYLLILCCIFIPASIAHAADNTIYTEEDFWAIADNPGGSYELANDITVSSDRDIFDFSGTFNGNGHTIHVSKQGSIRNMSLFAGLIGAHITDVCISGTYTAQKLDAYALNGFLASTADENTVIEYVECTGKYEKTFIVPSQMNPNATPQHGGIVGSNKGVIRNSINCVAYTKIANSNRGEIVNCISGTAFTPYEKARIRYAGGLSEDREYIIYREAWRNNRIEAVSFDTSSGFYTDVKWEPVQSEDGYGGKLYVDTAEYLDPVKYYWNDGEWIEFERGYEVISNNASEVLTSTLNVRENDGITYGIKHLVPECTLEPSTAQTFSFLDEVTVLIPLVSTMSQCGNPFISKSHYVGSRDFSAQYAAYTLNGEWIGGMELTSEDSNQGMLYGFKNADGEQVIPNEYTFIEPFFRDTARALNTSNEWGVIDKNGNVVAAFEIDPTAIKNFGNENEQLYGTGGISSYASDWHRHTYTLLADDGSKITTLDKELSLGNGRTVIGGKYIIDRRYVDVYIDGKYIYSEAPACIIGGSTMIPVRALCEALGCTVSYNPSNAEVHISKDIKDIYMNIGWDMMRCTDNGSEEITQLSVPAMIVSDRTLAPLRAASETLGFEVKWNATINRVDIES